MRLGLDPNTPLMHHLSMQNQSRVQQGLLILLGLVASLQVIASAKVPATIDASTISRRFERLLTPRDLVEIDAPDIVTPPEYTHPQPKSFCLRRVVLHGNTQFSDDELGVEYSKFLDKKITWAQLELIIENLTLYYHKHGYIISKVFLIDRPVQQGVVHLEVVEGCISKVKIDSPSPCLIPLLKKYAAELQGPRPLKQRCFQRFLLLANDIPGVTVTATLTPEEGKQGMAVLSVLAQTHRTRFSLGYDNFGLRWMGPQQYIGQVELNSVAVAGDQIFLHGLLSADGDELRFLQGHYLLPVGRYGTRLWLAGNSSNTCPGFTLGSYAVEGKADALTIAADHPLYRSFRFNSYLGFSFKIADNKLSILDNTRYEDRLRVFSAFSQLDYTDVLDGINVLALTLRKGVSSFGASDYGDAMLSRPAGRSDYTAIDGFVSRDQPLSTHYSCYLAVRGQYAFNPLLLSEQYLFGGEPFARAFDYAELTGDSAIAAKVELRYDTRPLTKLNKNAQYYIAYDAGVLWNRYAMPGYDRISATAVACGVRIFYTSHLFSELHLVKPLSRETYGEELAGYHGDEIRGFFRFVLTI